MRPKARAFPALAPALLALLLAGGCSDDSPTRNDGGGDDAFIPVSCPGGVDKSIDIDTAITVKEGEEQTGQICPRRDVDYYKVTIPSGKGLLRLNLAHPGPTQVELTYRIQQQKVVKDKDGKDVTVVENVGSAPPGKFNNFTGALHCLAPGDYYVVVQDSGDDGSDAKKNYTFSYTTEADQDQSENPPNDDADSATAITSGPMKGFISCTGDLDFYTITVAAGELLDIKLTTAKISEVDLMYTLYQKSGQNLEVIATSTVGDGTKKPANLEKIYPTPGAGEYYLVVQDDGNDDSDAATEYTLTVAKRPEPDTGDKPARNDHPKQATKFGAATGTENCSNPKVFTHTGRIASIGDVDVFEITGPATVPAGAQVLMDIEVRFSGTTEVDPAVNLILPDAATTGCKSDRCCQVLGAASASCTDVFSCSGSSFSCVTRSQEYCDECLDNAPVTCANTKSCAGSVTCLASGNCGYIQFSRNTKDGATLRTAQPILGGGPWYVRVSDFGGDEYDYDATYTLTVKVCADPDGAPDGGYFPRLVPFPNKPPEKDSAAFTNKDVEDHFNDQGKKLARTGPVIPTDGTFSAPITGTIGFEHDEDHITFNNPCPANEHCLLEAQFASNGSCPGGGTPVGSGLEFVYLLHKGPAATGGNARDGFPDDSGGVAASGTYGYDGTSGPCAILVQPSMSPTFRLVVSDLYHNNWSWSCSYSIRFRLAHTGCPEPPCTLQTTGPFTGSCYNAN